MRGLLIFLSAKIELRPASLSNSIFEDFNGLAEKWFKLDLAGTPPTILPFCDPQLEKLRGRFKGFSDFSGRSKR
jgi:hypothetical protein